MSKSPKIFIASGGTGGHIIPARCLAKSLSKNNKAIVTFLGDVKYKSYIKKNDKFRSKIISSSQIKRSKLFLIKAAVKISFGIFQTLILFLLHRPKYLITFGGYSTFPALIAALITRRKIILHEQNAHLGKVNRIFAKYAQKIVTSFEETSGILESHKDKVFFIGNLVREEILKLHKKPYKLPKLEEDQPEIPDGNKMGYDILLASEFYKDYDQKPDLFKILIIGGSGGAKIFSDILPKSFFNLSENIKEKIQVIQQVRQELLVPTFEEYKKYNINIIIDSFFENMPKLIEESHLIIARSGSSSIFEFCAAKKPMILIPFENSADNHQQKNASFLEKNGAALIVEEKEFTINNFGDILNNIIFNDKILKKMSKNAGLISKNDATKNFVKLILK